MKTGLRKKQEFEEGASVIVKPYEESMKKDSHDFEVLHTTLIFLTMIIDIYVISRENEGTEREAPSPGLGICQFH